MYVFPASIPRLTQNWCGCLICPSSLFVLEMMDWIFRGTHYFTKGNLYLGGKGRSHPDLSHVFTEKSSLFCKDREHSWTDICLLLDGAVIFIELFEWTHMRALTSWDNIRWQVWRALYTVRWHLSALQGRKTLYTWRRHLSDIAHTVWGKTGQV